MNQICMYHMDFCVSKEECSTFANIGPMYTILDSYHTMLLFTSDKGCSYTAPQQSGTVLILFHGVKSLCFEDEVESLYSTLQCRVAA